jgi:hypothetical protein
MVLLDRILRDPKVGMHTPLFQVDRPNKAWLPQRHVDLPGEVGQQGFVKVVADPLSEARLFVAWFSRVYQLDRQKGGEWHWTNLSDGLPGNDLVDLWCGNVGTQAKPRILLRACSRTRCVFERIVDQQPAFLLWLRKNLVDMPWREPVAGMETNPFNPRSAGRLSPFDSIDIKIESQVWPGETWPYPTSPESSTVDHVTFEEIREGSPSDPARLHVRVSNAGSNGSVAMVWALTPKFPRVQLGLPLVRDPTNAASVKAFWDDQFRLGGLIQPDLKDSPWVALGPPKATTGAVTASRPRVVTWDLARGALSQILVLVHSSESPLLETRAVADEVAQSNRQVALRSLYQGEYYGDEPPAPASGAARPTMDESIDFHNATPRPRDIALVLDLRDLPRALRLRFQMVNFSTDNVDGALRVGDEAWGEDAGASALATPVAPTAAAPDSPARSRLPTREPRVERLTPRAAGGAWLASLGERPSAPPVVAVASPRPIHEAAPSGLVRIGVKLAPLAVATVRFRLDGMEWLRPDTEHAFLAQQWEGPRLIGSCRFVLRIRARPIAG